MRVPGRDSVQALAVEMGRLAALEESQGGQMLGWKSCLEFGGRE